MAVVALTILIVLLHLWRTFFCQKRPHAPPPSNAVQRQRRGGALPVALASNNFMLANDKTSEITVVPTSDVLNPIYAEIAALKTELDAYKLATDNEIKRVDDEIIEKVEEHMKLNEVEIKKIKVGEIVSGGNTKITNANVKIGAQTLNESNIRDLHALIGGTNAKYVKLDSKYQIYGEHNKSTMCSAHHNMVRTIGSGECRATSDRSHYRIQEIPST